MISRTVKILSIDGGGTRGLIPALLLKEMEERLILRGERRPLSSLFDLIAGTSTGGLITLALACPGERVRGRTLPRYGTDDLVEVYTRRGGEIFPFGRFDALRTLGQAFYEKYDARGFEKLLKHYFGETTLMECLTSVLLTAYDVNRGRPYFLRYHRGRSNRNNLNFRLIDAARATSAAPTYFEPAEISPVGMKNHRIGLVDGAIVANNPALCAYTEARKIFPRAKKFVLISLGTGENPRRYTQEDMKHWGFFDWVNPARDVPLMSESFRGQSEATNHMLSQMPGVRFHRLDVPLRRSIEMDDARPGSLKILAEETENYIRLAEKQINAAVKAL